MLDELEGNGWIHVEPPKRTDEQSVVARYKGNPIKAGFTIDEDSGDDEVYMKFRSGKYDIELKLDLGIGRGQVRVEGADGYEN